jgi:hypothetical protein
MEDPKPHRHAGRSRLVLGLFLLALGGLMLAVNLGYQLPIAWWRFFPVPLMALGLWGLVVPSRHLDRSGGIWLFATGLYCLIGVFSLFGLGWGTAWPIFVIASGVSFLVRDVGREHRAPSSGPSGG